jgi:hypothetical protein
MKIIRTLQREFYGDSTRWFVATVVNATPHYGYEGRVKIRIHGVHSNKVSDIPEADLPWASIVIPTTEEGVSGLGKNPKLTAGSIVFGFFLDGESSQLPVVLGSLPREDYPTETQLTNLFTNDFETPISTPISSTLTSETEKRRRKRSEAMKFFIDSGYTVNQAAGIVGNLDYESRFVTTGSGIAKWNDTRKNNLVSFSQKFISAPELSENFQIQLKYVLYELRTNKTIANGKLLKATTIEGVSGSAETIRKFYINNSSKTASDDILSWCILAKQEIA